MKSAKVYLAGMYLHLIPSVLVPVLDVVSTLLILSAEKKRAFAPQP